MGQETSWNQPSKPTFWRDPRLYQIVSLSTLLLYGLVFLHFDIPSWQIVITIGTTLLTQYAGTRYFHVPSFDPKSALISSLSLCLLLRTNDLTVAALAAAIAILLERSRTIQRYDICLRRPTAYKCDEYLSATPKR